MAFVSIDTTVKGGLPVTVEADVEYDSFDRTHYVTDMTVFWASGKRVTDKVHNSIPESDWDRIVDEMLYQ